MRVLAGVWLVGVNLLALMSIAAGGSQDGAPESLAIVRGLTVYGMDNDQSLPVIVRDSINRDGRPLRARQYITIQFDVLASDPPALKIRFYHCDRNWNPDVNLFVQDETHNTSFVLDYRTAPNGVKNYRYRYVNRFPDPQDAVRFDYSGKWLFRLMDRSENTVFGEGRFIVVDKIAPTGVMVSNDYLTANSSPLNQIHKVVVTVRLPREIDGYYYTTVDVFQNRRLSRMYRIDANDRDPYTFVEGYNTGTRTFTISDIYPGNEYRILDLSSPTRFPNGSVVRLVEGADHMRLFWPGGSDHNGIASLNRFTGINSDYLDVLFRLDLTQSDFRSLTAGGKDIYVVGPFNQWEPASEDRLAYDENERSWVAHRLLRRGIYDYQYVTGVWDETTASVTQQDWLAVEGNDWRTSNTYTAIVYYNDSRFGGFDRIVGFAQGQRVGSLQGSH